MLHGYPHGCRHMCADSVRKRRKAFTGPRSCREVHVIVAGAARRRAPRRRSGHETPPTTFALAASLTVPASAHAATADEFAAAILQDPGVITGTATPYLAGSGTPLDVRSSSSAGFPTNGLSYGVIDSTDSDGAQPCNEEPGAPFNDA